MNRRWEWLFAGCIAACANVAAAQEIPSVAGWQIAMPTPASHRACVDLTAARTGKSCGKIVGITDEKGARAGFIHDFHAKTAIPAGRTYRYAVSYRTEDAAEGAARVIVDSYTKEGEKSRRELVLQKLAPSVQWQTVTGEVAVPEKVVRVRMLLYLQGKGTVWFDDVFFGDTANGAANRLKNGGLEPPDSLAYEMAPERKSGPVKFAADFDNATLGIVKQLGPDEFYVHALPGGNKSPFLWFHFRVEGAAGRELMFHVNTAPFSRDNTGGNGTRLPVASDDGDHWVGVENKSWSDDGTVLTFKHRYERSPAWVASFFPFTDAHIVRFIEQQKANPCFKTGVLGKTKGGRDMRLFTITEPTVPDAEKRVIMFTTLQHDLETTGAMAVEGICRFLLSDDPRAAGLRRAFVFYVVPMMDPDGIAQGNMYCPVGNLNRQWGSGTTSETTHVEKFIKDLASRGRKLELFMDFHGWCTPERKTIFMAFGKEITSETSERDATRLAETIKPKLSGTVSTPIWRKRIATVTGITSDLNCLACGWMKFEASARLAYSIEIFGEGECTQAGYHQWGRAFAEGIAEFYDCGRQ